SPHCAAATSRAGAHWTNHVTPTFCSSSPIHRLCTMAEALSPLARPRVRMARAIEILGLAVRRVQQKAERGELPGAIKIDGLWTFDEGKLFALLADLEQQQCATREAVKAERQRGPRKSRPSRTRTGAVPGTRKPSGRVSSSAASPSAGPCESDGPYDRAISMLRDRPLKRAAKG